MKGQGGINRTLCGPFARLTDIGEGESTYSPSENLLLNVEGLNERRWRPFVNRRHSTDASEPRI